MTLRRTITAWRGIIPLLLTLLLAGCAGSEEYQVALEEGIHLFRQGHFQPAAARLETALDLEPDESRPRLYLARTQIRLGRLKDAEGNLKYLLKEIGLDALENLEDRVSVYVDLGALQLRRAMDEGVTPSLFLGQGFFEKAMHLKPDHYLARLGKGFCFFGLDKLSDPGGGESALRIFTRCAELEPEKPEPLFFLGRCNEKDRLLSTLEALKLYEKVLALFGPPESLTAGQVKPRRVFSVPIRTIDVNYALQALERGIPLMARLRPEELGVDGVTLRERARGRLELYTRIGGRARFPRAVMDWMQGVTTTLKPPPTNPGGFLSRFDTRRRRCGRGDAQCQGERQSPLPGTPRPQDHCRGFPGPPG
ncbi:MAG: tetratricopeptide repeat protein [Planctomycetota bacterium]|jgi:hypothetical protein